MKLRYASEKDIHGIVKLINELGYQANDKLIKNRLEKIRQRNGRVIVAEDENENIIGCVHAFIDLRLAEGEIGEIVSLVVNKNVRGQGIGKKLLNNTKNWILETGCENIRIRANVKREDAHEFYKAHGFEEIKSQKIFQITIDS